jgi:hypothetical protein
MKSILTLIVGLACAGTALAANFYAAPGGTGTGSVSAPFGLQTGLEAGLKPGDTLWLRSGSYTGIFYSTLAGNASLPITVRSHTNEWARVVGGIAQNSGGYVIYRDFEVAGGQTNHTSSQPGSWPSDLKTLDALNIRAPGVGLVNLIIHDTLGNGACLWTEGPDSFLYGCVIYNNGFQGSDRGHGHGVYSQNNTGRKQIEENIVFNSYDHGIQIYGSSAAFLRHYLVDGNIAFNNGSLSRAGNAREFVIYGGDPPQDIKIVNNIFYFPNDTLGGIQCGEVLGRSLDLIFSNNFVHVFCRIADWERITAIGNTFIRSGNLLEFYQTQLPWSPTRHTWNYNTYYSLETPYLPFMFYTNASRGLTYANWRAATGFDSASVYTKGKPTGSRVFIRPNRYETGRANLAVFNWDLKPQLAINLGSTIPVNSDYEVRDAQNWFAGPVATGKYTGQPITLPLGGRVAAKPDGLPSAPAHTGPLFNAFVLRSRPGEATPPPTTNAPPTPVPLGTNGILLQGQGFNLLIMPQ